MRPFAFDRVEVGRIWREIFEDVPSVTDRVLNIGAFMESGIVHDGDGFKGHFGQ